MAYREQDLSQIPDVYAKDFRYDPTKKDFTYRPGFGKKKPKKTKRKRQRKL